MLLSLFSVKKEVIRTLFKTNAFFISKKSFHWLNKNQLIELNTQYSKKLHFQIFEPLIENHLINYFQIFSIVNRNEYQNTVYEHFREKLFKINDKNDNLFLLQAQISKNMSIFNWKNNNLKMAKFYALQALQILEKSIIPPILPYHQIYRQYGLILAEKQQLQQAKQVLIQSVEIIKKFIEDSQDQVSENSIEQAIAYTTLIKLDSNNSEKWLNFALAEWVNIDERKYNQKSYALCIRKKITNLIEQKKLEEAKKYAKEELNHIDFEYHNLIEDALQLKL